MRETIVGIVALGAILLCSLATPLDHDPRPIAIIAVTVLAMWFTRRK
jgi:hypothetical protein